MRLFMNYLLAIESSCDDFAAAILNSDGVVVSQFVQSQLIHNEYGGVVPELASREHLASIDRVVMTCFHEAGLTPRDIDAVAVTHGPGLIGSLLVGTQFAKGFAIAQNLPLVGVHHVEGHLLAGLGEPDFLQFPFIGLIVSGGHTGLYLVEETHITQLSETRDDAAGEAFDKAAKMLGFGYPGGPIIDRLAEQGDASRFDFPIALRSWQTLEFSFSGVKTAFRKEVQNLSQHGPLAEQDVADLCASLRKAVVEALLDKAILACRTKQIPRLLLGGGVACNRLLRKEAQERALVQDIALYLTPPKWCTDNAAMIGKAALRRMKMPDFLLAPLTVSARAEISHS